MYNMSQECNSLSSSVENKEVVTNSDLKQLSSYCCNVCKKSFAEISQFEAHLPDHSGGKKNQVCRLCFRTFASKAGLIEHLISHTGKRPYICETCGKAFSIKARLKAHVHLHTDNKHVCEICGKEFNQKFTLKNHLLKHNGKNFTCKRCGQLFKLESKLTSHLITCPSIWKCEPCGKSYVHSQSLSRHRRIRHPQ